MTDRRSNAVEMDEQAHLTEVLREMNDEGHFLASVLVSADGLPVSAISSPFDTQQIAAMVTLVRNTIEQARENIGLDEVDEVSVVQADKLRLICRYFVAGQEELVLAAIAPPHRTYRRLTNRAIRRIMLAWARRPAR